MEIAVKYQGHNAILRISQDILGEDRIRLNERIQTLVDNGAKNIVLNLKDAGLMDSVGLGMLVALQTLLGRRQIRLVLSDVGRTIEHLLLITKLTRVFERFDTEDEALADLK
ncbi:MAG: STAS domain-containing protein [Candidatus Poribacteria bacterium]|nr:STAS domain-containing protein [Candidatus Poribacteria bacterium]